MTTTKWFIIINPTAGGGKGGKYWSDIKELLSKTGVNFDFAVSEYSQHVIELTKKAIKEGYRKIIAVGGDGTINEVINGMFQQKIVTPSELSFANIPVGTGNDWIKTHGIPSNYKKAILSLKSGHSMAHDVGEVSYYDKNGEQKRRYFMNVAGLAYDAFVTKASQEGSRWMGTKMFYYYLILRCVTQYTATRAKITFDGQEVESIFYNIAVGICKHNAGGAQFVPHAIPDDGLFALAYFTDIKGIDVLLNSRKFYDGSIIHHPKCFTTQAKHIKIEAAEDSPNFVEVDGEFLGKTPIEFIMHQQAINVIVP
ncbi:MAG: diacylglycerol kinase family lipid kinase [Aureispira sp.]|nr:diacylglycerol kinase family lipid kinase [Aureispira sp.]